MKWLGTFLKKIPISNFIKDSFSDFRIVCVDGRTDQTEERQIEEQKDFLNMNVQKKIL
jgi:hypothetical protein